MGGLVGVHYWEEKNGWKRGPTGTHATDASVERYSGNVLLGWKVDVFNSGGGDGIPLWFSIVGHLKRWWCSVSGHFSIGC